MAISPPMLDVQKPQDVPGVTIEAWAQGFMVGSLMVMACVAFSNMRRRVLLHKLILLELVLGMFHGTFIFTDPPVYHWYLSVTAIFLNVSWSLHNVIAWIKNKPFLSPWGSRIYIGTVILVQPYWILEITANFLYFADESSLFVHTRPWEALFRDPWWIFTVCSLFYEIRSRYEFGYVELMRVSPRFAVLLGAMLMSVGFIIVDILAVTRVIDTGGLADGINPFFKLAFVFKCLTDTIVLDDFKTALDRLKEYRLQQMGSLVSDGVRGEFDSDPGHAHEVRSPIALPPVFATAVGDGVRTRDWEQSKGGGEDLDLEAALRLEYSDESRSG